MANIPFSFEQAVSAADRRNFVSFNFNNRIIALPAAGWKCVCRLIASIAMKAGGYREIKWLGESLAVGAMPSVWF